MAGKIKTNPFWRNKNKYYEFHRDHVHNTKECFQLNEQITDLINRGYLRKFIADRPRPASPNRGYTDNIPTTRDIQTIHGGFRSGGCSYSSWKRHAREAKRGRGIQPLHTHGRSTPFHYLRKQGSKRLASSPRRCFGNIFHNRQFQRPKDSN